MVVLPPGYERPRPLLRRRAGPRTLPDDEAVLGYLAPPRSIYVVVLYAEAVTMARDQIQLTCCHRQEHRWCEGFHAPRAPRLRGRPMAGTRVVVGWYETDDT